LLDSLIHLQQSILRVLRAPSGFETFLGCSHELFRARAHINRRRKGFRIECFLGNPGRSNELGWNRHATHDGGGLARVRGYLALSQRQLLDGLSRC
jgi:hypothetical protein